MQRFHFSDRRQFSLDEPQSAQRRPPGMPRYTQRNRAS